MSTTTDRTARPPTETTGGGNRRWLILVVLATAQLMVVLDATIVNIALPEAQKSLGFSDDQRQWVVTAYSLAFGSLLLLGGRITDMFGRRTVFIVGLVGFAASSALGGWGPNFEILVTARALQGVFGALLAPAALSLLTVTFAGSRDRAKAFSIYGAISGAGGAVGLLMGGVLTEYISWNWCLYVNVFFAVVAVIGAVFLLPRRESAATKPRLDWIGTILVTSGLFMLVYGFANSESKGWSAGSTIVFLVAGVVVLAAFVWTQTRSAHPLLPLRIVLDRTRGTSYLVMLISAIGMFGMFLFLTYYLQQTLGYSPVITGVAFLPMVAALAISASVIGSTLATRLSPKILVTAGLAVAACGMALLTTIGADTSYATGILPSLLIFGGGVGAVFSSAMSLATVGVDKDDAGVASAMLNTAQQVGGSIGVAVLSSVSASAITSYIESHTPSVANPQAMAAMTQSAAISGYQTVFWLSAGFFAVGALLSGLLYRNEVPQVDPDAEPVIAH